MTSINLTSRALIITAMLVVSGCSCSCPTPPPATTTVVNAIDTRLVSTRTAIAEEKALSYNRV